MCKHQIQKGIEEKYITVMDFKFNGKTKLYNVTTNKVIEMPEHFQIFSNAKKSYRGLMYASYDEIVSLSSTDLSLRYHYNRFRNFIEIINHDCIDFVFYNNKENQEMRKLSKIEENNQFTLQIDLI